MKQTTAKTTTTKTVKPAASAVKPAGGAKPVPSAKPTAARPEKKIKVLFATTEAFPFAGTGGLGEVVGSLPKALNRLGVDARVIMPLYGSIPRKYRDRMQYIGNMRVWGGWRNQYCGVFRIDNDGVTTYFVDNEQYFLRDSIYGQHDDGERFTFFSRAVLECIPMLDFTPDIIHSNDHATALIPTFYKACYALMYGHTGIKNVFTVHNLEYQGCYPPHILGDVMGLGEDMRGVVDFNCQVNCVKSAIESADSVTTVSPTYAEEILRPDRAFGLSDILNRNRSKLVGILNGVNVEEYDPETSPFIAKNYNAEDPSGKAECKRALKQELGLEGDRPIIAVISRLAGHKGRDLVKGALCRNSYAFENADLVVLGTGERYLEDFFRYHASCHGNSRALITFDKSLAQRIYAGADIFLMPSATEPCGLSQMMACRYGTIPIVRKTGGLADSIKDCRAGGGNGFVFEDYTVEALEATVADAVRMYGDKAEWSALMQRAFACDFSWNASARKYLELYKDLLKK